MPAVIYRDAALADGRSPRLRVGVSVLVRDGRIAWIRPSGDEGGQPPDCEIVDAGGTAIVPGMVDGHSHLTLPGGSHWIDRGADPTRTLLAVAEANGELQHRSGVRWARDAGSPARDDGDRERALSIGIRDRWRGRRDRPYVRAAGTWITIAGLLPAGLTVEVRDGDGLLAAALGQLDDGADFVKLYLDGPDPGTPPFSAAEVARVVDAVHARGAKVTARGCTLVTTMTVLKSWLSFGTTTTLPRFTQAQSRVRIAERLERARESVRLAHAAGVAIAGGTDFGGGSARATWRGGELLGEPDAGVIAEGGPADFSLVHGDPLSDPTALWRVWRVA